MFKKIIAAFAALLAATAFAAVDANKASQAELEALKGIGPVISTLIISERKKGNFKDWNDLVVRVKGVGDKSAEKFSEAGLTVNGATFTGAPMATPTAPKAATKPEKADKPMATPATAAAPAPAAVPARAASAAKETASKAASAVKTGAEKAASGTRSAAATAKETAREEKDAAKTKAEEAKDKRAAKKAEKAETKAEKAAATASAPMKK